MFVLPMFPVHNSDSALLELVTNAYITCHIPCNAWLLHRSACCVLMGFHRDCPGCGNHCFASRMECNRCQTQKPPGESGYGREGGYQGGGYSGGYGGGGGGYNKRPGDW